MNYPSGIKKNNTNKINNINYGNRGMGLEYEINLANQYYLDNDIAVIYKKPIPITINKVDYPSRIEAVIKEAYFKTPSTTDYNGIYKGKYIDFEAKETKNTTSFPLNNIHNHQIKHMEKIITHKGICFVIVRFTKLNRTYLLFARDLIDFINNETRKSIPLNYFEEKAYLIKDKLIPKIDYLEVINMYGGMYETKEN
jgi:recombination protein U